MLHGLNLKPTIYLGLVEFRNACRDWGHLLGVHYTTECRGISIPCSLEICIALCWGIEQVEVTVAHRVDVLYEHLARGVSLYEFAVMALLTVSAHTSTEPTFALATAVTVAVTAI